MKKILFLVPLFALLMGVYSCDDNEDYTNPHILTTEEMDTLRKSDSIKEAKKNAPLEFEYTVNMYSGADNYSSLEPDYDAIGEKFDLSAAQVVSMIQSGEIEHTFWINNETEQYTGDCTANGVMGYWMDGTGTPVKYASETCAWFLEWQQSDGSIAYGDFSNSAIGDQANVMFKLVYRERTVLIHVTMNYLELTDTEEKPGTTPADLTKDITLTKDWSSSWDAATYDAHDDLCNAFNMTTYELSKALEAGEINIYLNEVTDGAPNYTANTGGYWINGDGQVTTYETNSYIYTVLSFDITEHAIVIEMGNYPSETMCPKGITLSYKFIITNGTTTVTYNVTSTVN